MQIQLKKIGNSKGFTIPAALLEELGWTERTSLVLDAIEGGLSIVRGTPDLSEMLSSVKTGIPDHEKFNRNFLGKESEE